MSEDEAAWLEYEQLPARQESAAMGQIPVATSLNHGGPGICRLCFPKGTTPDARKPVQPTQQEELQL